MDGLTSAASTYHTILGYCGLDLLRTMLRPIRMAQCACRAGMGRKGGGVSRCRCCTATATFAVCSVCKGEGGKIEGLVAVILQARPVRWVSLRPCTAYSVGSSVILMLACTRGPGTLKPGSSEGSVKSCLVVSLA